jgi:Arc/MetJ-type ribon-helix-helix transcriptional regulator
MSRPKIEIDEGLWARVREHVATGGYSSPEEFVQHVIERELSKTDQGETSAESARKIRGIGYIDAGRDI